MNQKPLFSLNEVSVPEGLMERVIATIYQRQRTSRLWRMRISVGAGIASIAALVPVGISLVNSFAVSHFGAYASLLTDTAALTYWKEISVSLLESLPAAALTMTVALIGVLLWSTRVAIGSITTKSTQLRHA